MRDESWRCCDAALLWCCEKGTSVIYIEKNYNEISPTHSNSRVDRCGDVSIMHEVFLLGFARNVCLLFIQWDTTHLLEFQLVKIVHQLVKSWDLFAFPNWQLVYLLHWATCKWWNYRATGAFYVQLATCNSQLATRRLEIHFHVAGEIFAKF